MSLVYSLLPRVLDRLSHSLHLALLRFIVLAGGVAWSYFEGTNSNPNTFGSPVVIASSGLVVAAVYNYRYENDAILIALNASTGAVAWRAPRGVFSNAVAPPAACVFPEGSGGTIVVAVTGWLLRINGVNGSVMSTWPLPSSMRFDSTSPVISTSGVAYVAYRSCEK